MDMWHLLCATRVHALSTICILVDSNDITVCMLKQRNILHACIMANNIVFFLFFVIYKRNKYINI